MFSFRLLQAVRARDRDPVRGESTFQRISVRLLMFGASARDDGEPFAQHSNSSIDCFGKHSSADVALQLMISIPRSCAIGNMPGQHARISR